MTANEPNAFIQTTFPKGRKGEDRLIMKITGGSVKLIIDITPKVYGPFVSTENDRRVLYLQVLMTLYGALIASLLWYKKFRTGLEYIGFEFNPYDVCVANHQTICKQHTVRFHVDVVMSSHFNKRVNDNFADWLNHMYAAHGPVKAVREKFTTAWE
jgi:hypothetical protein